MSIDNVLVIEDDSASAVLLQFLIEDVLNPRSVITKEDGEEAIRYLNESIDHPEQFPQLIFLDLNMPNISGYEFMVLYEEKFSLLFPNTQLIVLTSSVREKDREISLQHASVAGFFRKPLEEKQLQQIREEIENM